MIKTRFKTEMHKLVLLPILLLIMASSLFSQVNLTLDLNMTCNKQLFIPRLAAAQAQPDIRLDDFNIRRDRCLMAGKWIGGLAGSTIGIMHLTFAATGASGIHGSFAQNLLTAVPSIAFGSYIGVKMNEWTTKQILKGEPKLLKAFLKGVGYGALDGAVILSASIVPLFIVAYYLDTIHFNFDTGKALFGIIGTGILGGIGYGGMYGIMIGGIYGPCISLYMKF
ncbi:hypothetical protein JXI42_03520 [bacterium]|nr:hypothetical protein [bacterium]